MIFQVKTRAQLKVFELDIPTRDRFLFSGSRECFVFFFFLTFFPHIGKDFFSLTHRPCKDRRTVSVLPVYLPCNVTLALMPRLDWKCQCANLWRFPLSPCNCLGIFGHLCTFPGVSKYYPLPPSYPKFLGTARGGKYLP